MSRVQLALRVSDLEASVAFYAKLFGVEPAKRRPGYANFAVEQPPLKLVLIEGEPDRPTALDHLGVEVFDGAEVDAATRRLTDAGLVTLAENDTSCCYAVQDKVWVRGPGDEPWEVYVVKADADNLAKSPEDACRCGEPDGTSVTASVPAATSATGSVPAATSVAPSVPTGASVTASGSAATGCC